MKYLLVLIFTFNCLAEDGIVYLKKGEVAPFDGVFFSKEQELKLRQMKYDKDATDQKNITLQDLSFFQQKQIAVLEKRVEVFQNQSNILAQQNVSYENSSFSKSLVYFGLGAIATGLIFYGASQVYR